MTHASGLWRQWLPDQMRAVCELAKRRLLADQAESRLLDRNGLLYSGQTRGPKHVEK